MKVATAAKLIGEYDASRPDENIEYYQAKLTDLFEKFQRLRRQARIVRRLQTRKGRCRCRRHITAGFFSTPEK